MSLETVPHLRAIDRPVARALPADPLFPRASEAVADKVSDPCALLLGVPFSGGSISGANCHEAPAALRGILPRFSAYSSDFGVSLEIASVLDVGDVEVVDAVPETQARIEACIRALGEVYPELPLVVVGGDNSVTAACVPGTGCDGLITFDAHHDVRDGFSNGSPVRQILADGVMGERIVQIGIHGFANGRAYAERASEAGIVWVSPTTVRTIGIDAIIDQSMQRVVENGATRVWVDVDLDCLDRAFAPGTAASMPGGLWPSDLERGAFLLGASPLIAGLDLTEIDPSTDVGEVTIRTACAVMLAFYAGVMSR